MLKTIKIIVLATLCLNFSSKAQFYKPSDKTVRMGETLPDSFYQTVHQAVNAKTGKSTTIQLKNYKNKLIILDFWATWCGPCIHSLNELDSTQKAVNNKDYIVIPVTYQSTKEAIPTLNKYKWNLTSIVGDTTLAQIFPHSGIPHQVWIKDGMVIAIPKWQYASSLNINKAIKAESLTMIMNIQDGLIDPKKPLFVKGNGYTGKPLYAKGKYSVIARRIPGFQAHKVTTLQTLDTTVLYAYNLPLTTLFYGAYKAEIAAELNTKEGSGIYLDISNKLRNKLFSGPEISKGGNYEQDMLAETWRDANLYSYNLRYPKMIGRTDALKIMQSDLNTFFGAYLNLSASIEMKPKPAVILKVLSDKTETEKLLLTKGDPFAIDYGTQSGVYKLKNAPVNALLSWLSRMYPEAVFIDSTGIENLNIDINISKNTSENPDRIQNELVKYGLSLQMGEALLPALAIKERRTK